MPRTVALYNGDNNAIEDSLVSVGKIDGVTAVRGGEEACDKVTSSMTTTEGSENKLAMAVEFDHMYIGCSDSKASIGKDIEVQHLKDLLLLHLDLIQQQAEQLVAKDKQIKTLRDENENLRAKLERMDRRVSLSLHKKPSEASTNTESETETSESTVLKPARPDSPSAKSENDESSVSKPESPFNKSPTSSLTSKAGSPTIKTLSPCSKSGSPSSRILLPSNKTGSPGTKPVSPTSKTIPPTNKSVSPSSKSGSPPSKAASPCSKPSSPTCKTVSPSSKPVITGSKAESPCSNNESSGNKAESPFSKAGSPNKSTSPSNKVVCSKPSSPCSKAVSPCNKVGSPSSKAGSPSSKVGSPSSKAGSPPSKAGSPPSKIGSSPSKAGSPSSKSESSSKPGSPNSKAGSPSKPGSPSSKLGSPSTKVVTPEKIGSPSSKTRISPNKSGRLELSRKPSPKAVTPKSSPRERSSRRETTEKFLNENESDIESVLDQSRKETPKSSEKRERHTLKRRSESESEMPVKKIRSDSLNDNSGTTDHNLRSRDKSKEKIKDTVKRSSPVPQVDRPATPTSRAAALEAKKLRQKLQLKGQPPTGRAVRGEGILNTSVAYYLPYGALIQDPNPEEECLQAQVEIPRWGTRILTSLYVMEGTENLEDEVFLKRHARPEQDEKRRKRWDLQRMREQRHYERLRERYEGRQTASEPEVSGYRSLWPNPESALYLHVDDCLPVCAFGQPMARIHPQEFALPWLSGRSQDGVSTRRRKRP
ncbi:uncharacterized protein [Panulirus ornatus]|uniref:uncharacterized protein isoform X2 n=1 Tax=Panulirus ornatus TaxID=150431 RepID=UPI003A88EA3A